MGKRPIPRVCRDVRAAACAVNDGLYARDVPGLRLTSRLALRWSVSRFPPRAQRSARTSSSPGWAIAQRARSSSAARSSHSRCRVSEFDPPRAAAGGGRPRRIGRRLRRQPSCSRRRARLPAQRTSAERARAASLERHGALPGQFDFLDEAPAGVQATPAMALARRRVVATRRGGHAGRPGATATPSTARGGGVQGAHVSAAGARRRSVARLSARRSTPCRPPLVGAAPRARHRRRRIPIRHRRRWWRTRQRGAGADGHPRLQSTAACGCRPGAERRRGCSAACRRSKVSAAQARSRARVRAQRLTSPPVMTRPLLSYIPTRHRVRLVHEISGDHEWLAASSACPRNDRTRRRRPRSLGSRPSGASMLTGRAWVRPRAQTVQVEPTRADGGHLLSARRATQRPRRSPSWTTCVAGCHAPDSGTHAARDVGACRDGTASGRGAAARWRRRDERPQCGRHRRRVSTPQRRRARLVGFRRAQFKTGAAETVCGVCGAEATSPSAAQRERGAAARAMPRPSRKRRARRWRAPRRRRRRGARSPTRARGRATRRGRPRDVGCAPRASATPPTTRCHRVVSAATATPELRRPTVWTARSARWATRTSRRTPRTREAKERLCARLPGRRHRAPLNGVGRARQGEAAEAGRRAAQVGAQPDDAALPPV